MDMINRVIKNIKNIFASENKFEEDIAINMNGGVGGSWSIRYADKNINDDYPQTSSIKTSYTGIPAPVQTPYDYWFSDISLDLIQTEKQITHEEMLEEAKRREDENREEEKSESENIHQLMYDISTQNWNTTNEILGGSENFHEGPGGWNSGSNVGAI
jgi:hypothetical protein